MVYLLQRIHAVKDVYKRQAYDNANDPKELLVIPNCNHVDLYDNITKIPFDKIETFFRNNLK